MRRCRRPPARLLPRSSSCTRTSRTRSVNSPPRRAAAGPAVSESSTSCSSSTMPSREYTSQSVKNMAIVPPCGTGAEYHHPIRRTLHVGAQVWRRAVRVRQAQNNRQQPVFRLAFVLRADAQTVASRGIHQHARADFTHAPPPGLPSDSQFARQRSKHSTPASAACRHSMASNRLRSTCQPGPCGLRR